MTRNTLGTLALLGITTGIAGIKAQTASADIQHLDDVIITFSLCVGNDCVNGENFGFDTLRLKENNLRIHFDDTSVSGSFPRNDWRIVINDSGNGGDSYFRIEDSTAGRGVFQIDAGAPANALRVDSAGDVGIGASNPVVELHVKDGDSPTLRLEQDGSSGFTAQTFDLVSNEANFFIRDVTNGSQLPFRIKPGADSDSLFIAANNNVGVGTDAPASNLHVRATTNTGVDNTGGGLLFVQNTNGTAAPRTIAGFTNNGAVEVNFNDTSSTVNPTWKLANLNDKFQILSPAVSGPEFQLDQNGNLTVAGTITTATQTLPDYVFDEEYQLMPLSELASFIKLNGHLPKIPNEQTVLGENKGQYNMTEMQMSLLEKVEELTLYILAQQETIDDLQRRLDVIRN